jgi:hypothetical protein
LDLVETENGDWELGLRGCCWCKGWTNKTQKQHHVKQATGGCTLKTGCGSDSMAQIIAEIPAPMIRKNTSQIEN